MKSGTKPAPFMPWPGAELIQPFWDTYVQANAETLVYTTKMNHLVLEMLQHSLNSTFKAIMTMPNAGASNTALGGPASLPDMMTGIQQLQSAMFNNAAQWQQQFKDQFQEASGTTLSNISRYRH